MLVNNGSMVHEHTANMPPDTAATVYDSHFLALAPKYFNTEPWLTNTAITLRFDILLTPFRVADSTLINGLGRNVKGPADAPLAVIGVESGKRCVNVSKSFRYQLTNNSFCLKLPFPSRFYLV